MAIATNKIAFLGFFNRLVPIFRAVIGENMADSPSFFGRVSVVEIESGDTFTVAAVDTRSAAHFDQLSFTVPPLIFDDTGIAISTSSPFLVQTFGSRISFFIVGLVIRSKTLLAIRMLWGSFKSAFRFCRVHPIPERLYGLYLPASPTGLSSVRVERFRGILSLPLIGGDLGSTGIAGRAIYRSLFSLRPLYVFKLFFGLFLNALFTQFHTIPFAVKY